MKILAVLLTLMPLGVCACSRQAEHAGRAPRQVTVTNPQSKNVTITESYVGQIQAQRHVKVSAVGTAYVEEIAVREGQAVREGDLLFKVRPILHQEKLAAANADVKIAELEFDHARQLLENKLVPEHEVVRFQTRLQRARAHLAVELSFAAVNAPFDGIVDRLQRQQGSLVAKGEILTTLSDNSVMHVYFNVPETRYLEYMANKDQEDLQVELKLASGKKFPQTGKIGAIDAHFNHETGTIHFRADFPNPDRLLRHGQTGTLLISRVQSDALVVPQRATFEFLGKRYVYVVDKESVVHRREIVVARELDDLYVVQQGIGADDKIVLEGLRQVSDGEKVESTPQQLGQVTRN